MLGLSVGIVEVRTEEEKLRSMILKVTHDEKIINAIINSGVEIKDIIKYFSGAYCSAVVIGDKIQSSLMNKCNLDEKESGRLMISLKKAN